MLKVQGQRVIDSGGGFLIEENDELEQQMVCILYKNIFVHDDTSFLVLIILHI